jgi:hypothetical protein
MRRSTRLCAVVAATALAVTPAATALADDAATNGAPASSSKGLTKDRNVPVTSPEDVRTGKFDKFQGASAADKRAAQQQAQPQLRSQKAASEGSPPVGTVKTWLALDDTQGYYLKEFQLMGVGDHIEIWVAVQTDENGNAVAQDLRFPAGSEGECRNEVFDGGEVTVTQEQVDGFIEEFDQNMYPKESAAFSTPKSRPGTNLAPTFGRPFNEILGVPADYWAGDGDKIVTLVDNVRDENFYDPSTPDGQTYIAGFFSSLYSDTFDRNIMNIDSFDWLHRTGANPPDDQPNTTGCEYAGVAPRPYRYEGIFAHEYQHLLMHDEDADEVNWVNEGLSDWAQTLVGYVDPSLPGTDPNADSHIACFQGWLGDNFGGPENSLTQWGDQGGPEILCDYGAAYTMMEYLHGRFGGDAFMSALHREDANGLVGLQRVMNRFGYRGITAQEVVHQWQAMVALDRQIDEGAKLKGGAKRDYTAPTLTSDINWDTEQAYATPGAPPNGADYVRLGDRRGYIDAKRLDSLEFRGAGSYAPDPVEWTTDGGRLFSGAGDNLDRGIARQVTVPSDPSQAVLSADLEWGTEVAWDFAFVQVYDPQAQDWVSLADREGNATSEHDPAADPKIVAELPGFDGPNPADPTETTGVQTLTFDLSQWAGQTIDIAFRYMTDGAVTGAGFWVDNVAIGGQQVSDGTDLGEWDSLTGARPVKVAGWTVQLVAYGDGKKAYVGSLRVRYNERRDEWIGRVGRDVAELVGNKKGTTTVGAIVTADDPDEIAPSYPTYELRANGVTQPGGS